MERCWNVRYSTHPEQGQGQNMARISLYFDVCCECFCLFCFVVVVVFSPFYVTAYSAENNASMSGFK